MDRRRSSSISSNSSSRAVEKFFPNHSRRSEAKSPVSFAGAVVEHANFNGSITSTNNTKDPRLISRGAETRRGENDSRNKTYNNRKALKSLPVPVFEYNSESVGKPPKGQIMLTGLPELVRTSAITTSLSEYGEIEKVKILRDDVDAPMSVGSVTFRGTQGYKSARKIASIGVVRIEGKQVSVKYDPTGRLASRQRQELISIHARLQNPAPKGPRVDRELEQEQERSKEKDKQLRDRERKHTIPRREVPLTPRMRRSIGSYPFLYISDRYLPSVGREAVRHDDLYQVVRRFRPSDILRDEYGWYVLFSKSRACRDCKYAIDGDRLFGYKLVVEEGNRQRGGSPASASRHQPSEPHAGTTAHNSQIPNGKGPELDPKDAVEDATCVIVKQLQSILSSEIQQRVINREIYAVLKENMAKARQQQEIEAAKEREKLIEMEKKREISRKAHKTTLSKPLRLAVDEDSDAMSTRVTTPAETPSETPQHDRSPEPEPALASSISSIDKKKKRKSRRDFSSSESESEGPDLKRSKPQYSKHKLEQPSDDYELKENGKHVGSGKDNSKATAIRKENKMEIDDDGETKMDVASGEKMDIDHVDTHWKPKEGTSPQSAITDPEGPYDVIQLLNMIKDEQDLKYLQDVAKLERPADIGSAHAFVYRKRQLLKDHPVANAFTSFKSRGYAKIPESEKDSYLAHRRENKAKPVLAKQESADRDDDAPHTKTSSRGNRVNARREEKHINDTNDLMSINKLKKRKKPVEFRRSAIHDWGLYAMEPIPANEMIIEYVGERIRSSLQDTRERTYTKSGIGSSYLFHVDHSQVIDATKRGGIARFINHSCQPSCLAKIIQVQGTSRIVIYAARDIGSGEELTYDYKFEREEGEDRVPCLCGTEKCKGWLN